MERETWRGQQVPHNLKYFDLLKLSSYFQRTAQWMCSGGNLRCSFFISVFFNFLFVIFEDTAHQRRCRRQTGLRLHICSLIGVLRHPPAFLWKLETAAEASSLLAVQGQGPTPGTNVGEILWTSSSHAETAVINSWGYFQTTLVRFTQRCVWSGPGWASGAGSGYRSVPTNIQRHRPANCSSLYQSSRLQTDLMSTQ